MFMNFCLIFWFECSIINFVWVGNETFAHWRQLHSSLWLGRGVWLWPVLVPRWAGCPVCGSYAQFFVLLCNFEQNQLFCAPALWRIDGDPETCFKPLFNRLLPKCVCLRGPAPDPAMWLTAPPKTPSWKRLVHTPLHTIIKVQVFFS